MTLLETTTKPNETSGPYVSVIIPCYNEEKNLEAGVLDEVYRYLVAQTYPWEVIIVNDEATDNSRALVAQFVADKPRFSLLDIPHGGKPAAVWAGIQQARGELVLFTDMDQSTPIAELDKLLPWYERGFDVVIGSRGSERKGFSALRQIGSVVFRSTRRLFLLRGISDTQCGFKCFRRERCLKVFELQTLSGFCFDVEIIYLAKRLGLKILEVPVTWRNSADTRVGALKDSLRMLRDLLRIRLQAIMGKYRVNGKREAPAGAQGRTT